METKEILNKMKEAVILGDDEAALASTREALERGINAKEALEGGLMKGIKEVGNKWAREEIFLSEVFFSVAAFKIGSDILEREIERMNLKREFLGKILLGTVQGDIHDLGKNIIGTYLRAAGFDVYDLGVDVSPEIFIKKAKELKPDVIGLSALLSYSLPMQEKVIEALKEAGLRDKIKVIIGGSANTEEWAKKIGADAFGRDALDGLEKIKKMLGIQ